MHFPLHLILFSIQLIYAVLMAVVLTPITFVLMLALNYRSKKP